MIDVLTALTTLCSQFHCPRLFPVLMAVLKEYLFYIVGLHSRNHCGSAEYGEALACPPAYGQTTTQKALRQ